MTKIPAVKQFLTHVPSKVDMGFEVSYNEYKGEVTAAGLHRQAVLTMDAERNTYPLLDISRIMGKINQFESAKVNVLQMIDTKEEFDSVKGLQTESDKDLLALFYSKASDLCLDDFFLRKNDYLCAHRKTLTRGNLCQNSVDLFL